MMAMCEQNQLGTLIRTYLLTKLITQQQKFILPFFKLVRRRGLKLSEITTVLKRVYSPTSSLPIQNHLLTAHSEPPPRCPFKTTSSLPIQNHLLAAHSELPPRSLPIQNHLHIAHLEPPPRFPFKTTSSLPIQNHLLAAHIEPLLRCAFRTTQSLKMSKASQLRQTCSVGGLLMVDQESTN